MDQNHTASPQAATDAPASPSSDPARIPRRLRHDGWTGDKQARMLEMLAATGVVSDACHWVGMSPQSAYAFRNRAAGRTFGILWDAVLRHRAPGRVADEMMSRAMRGTTDTLRGADGNVVSERHRYDNRLSMSVLTRLDRIADKKLDEPDDRLLRAVSEDLDDLLDCIEDGGDADAIIEAIRNPPPPPAAVTAAARARLSKFRAETDADVYAQAMGVFFYKAMNPFDIDIGDYDTARCAGKLTSDVLMRAHYSGYWVFQDCVAADRRDAEDDPDYDGDPDEDFPDCAATFMRERDIHRSRHLRRKADAALSARKAELRGTAGTHAMSVANAAASSVPSRPPQPSTSTT